MISFTFETQWPVYGKYITLCFLLLAALCCCNGSLHQKTAKMADPLQSVSESSTMPVTTKLPETAVVDLGALLDAGDGSVVTLVAGDTRLAAHRAVLVAGSPVFAAMFGHDTPEANSSEVVIKDVEGAVLRQLVAFLYTDRAPLLHGMAPQLLAAAKRYGVSALMDPCGQQAPERVTMENAAAAAVLAVWYRCHSLRQAAVAFIQDHLQVMATQCLAEAVDNHPDDVVHFTRLFADTSTTTTTDCMPTPTATHATITVTPTTKDGLPTTTAAPTAATTATAAESTSTPTAATPTTTTATAQPHSSFGQTAATAALLTAGHHTPSPDAAAISHLRSLSGNEKSRRLIQAAKEGAVEEVRALIAAGADVGARDEKRWRRCTALHWAAERGHVAVIRLLLAASAGPDARDDSGWTPLHVAAYNGQAAVAAVLLKAGANKAATTNLGYTALKIARGNKNSKLIQMLQ